MSSLANYISQIDLAGAADGDVLTYNSAEPSKFELAPPGALSAAVDDLTDVVITAVADGHVLTWDSGTSKWVNEAPAAASGSSKLCLCRAVTSTGDTGAPQSGGGAAVNVPFGTVIFAATAEVEVTANDLYTIKTAGNYKIEVDVGFNASSNGNVEIRIQVNGTDVKRLLLGVATVNVIVSGHFHYAAAFSLNDTIEVTVASTAGNDIYIRGTSGTIMESSLTITKEG